MYILDPNTQAALIRIKEDNYEIEVRAMQRCQEIGLLLKNVVTLELAAASWQPHYSL